MRRPSSGPIPISASTVSTSWPWASLSCGGDIAHVEDDIGLAHLVQGGAEGLDQLVRQIRDEPHGVGQDR